MIASESGTIQVSILGPIFYVIYVSPQFDLQKLLNYANDKFVICWNKYINNLIIDMQTDLEAMIEWLMQSGLKVNETKTKMCFFHRNLSCIITLTIKN